MDSKSNVTVTTREIKPQANVHDDDDDWKGFNSIGKKIMRMMGWMGGGLGKSEQGVVEPMSVTLVKNFPSVSNKLEKKPWNYYFSVSVS